MYIYLDKRSYTIRTRKQWTQTKIKKLRTTCLISENKIEMKKIQLFIYYENLKTFGQNYVISLLFLKMIKMHKKVIIPSISLLHFFIFQNNTFIIGLVKLCNSEQSSVAQTKRLVEIDFHNSCAKTHSFFLLSFHTYNRPPSGSR